MTDRSDQIIIERNRRRAALFDAARASSERAMAHIALVASGAIVISINMLVPLATLRGGLRLVSVLVGSWVGLASCILCVVPYRVLVSARLKETADALVTGDDLTAQNKSLSRWSRVETVLVGYAYGSFLVALVLMMVFVIYNLPLVVV